MHSFNQSKILPYEIKSLYDLVLDIESYPQFLPWCAAARVISKTNKSTIAELVICAKGLLEKYQSEVSSKEQNGRYYINAKAISGPFKYLNNKWEFEKTSLGTKVTFHIDFQLRFILLDKLMGGYFGMATEKMIDAFERRAAETLIKI